MCHVFLKCIGSIIFNLRNIATLSLCKISTYFNLWKHVHGNIVSTTWNILFAHISYFEKILKNDPRQMKHYSFRYHLHDILLSYWSRGKQYFFIIVMNIAISIKYITKTALIPLFLWNCVPSANTFFLLIHNFQFHWLKNHSDSLENIHSIE